MPWIALAAAAGMFTACDDGDGDSAGTCEVVPGAWDASGFDANAAEALSLREAIRALQNDLLNAAEQNTWGDTPMGAPTLAQIIAAYEAGSPSIASMTAPALDALVRQSFADWVEAMAADPASYRFIDQGAWVAPGAGGVHELPPGSDGTRRFRAYSAGGVELRQLVDKGLFVGTLYNYALSLTEGTITPATIHAIAAAWGANPRMEASPADGEPNLDDTANYARSMGLFAASAAALTAAQAYARDASCTAQRDASLVEFFGYWEEAVFARGIYYAHEPIRATLDPSNPESILGPLHGASEGYGLVAGLFGLPNPSSGPLAGRAKVATDAQISNALETLGLDLGDLSAGTTGSWLVDDVASYEAGLVALKAIVQPLLAWSDAEFETYAHNPVADE